MSLSLIGITTLIVANLGCSTLLDESLAQESASLGLHHAADQRDLSSLRQALESEDIDKQINFGSGADMLGVTALMLAAWQGWREGVEFLIDRGADISLHSEIGFTALHHAAFSECPPCIEALIDAGLDVGVRSELGVTPLHLAVSYSSSVDVVRTLLRRGAVIDEAAICGPGANFNIGVELIDILIDHGASVNIDCGNGYRPLSFAIVAENEPVAMALLDHSSDETLNTVDEDGNTPLLLAAKNGMCEILEALSARDINWRHVNREGENAIHLLAASSEFVLAEDCFESVVVHSRDIHQRDVHGRTPLMRTRNHRRATCLLEHGAEVNARDNEGNTALHYTLRFSAPTSLVLIERGADVNMPDSDGVLPLERAKRAKQWWTDRVGHVDSWNTVIKAIVERQAARRAIFDIESQVRTRLPPCRMEH